MPKTFVYGMPLEAAVGVISEASITASQRPTGARIMGVIMGRTAIGHREAWNASMHGGRPLRHRAKSAQGPGFPGGPLLSSCGEVDPHWQDQVVINYIGL